MKVICLFLLPLLAVLAVACGDDSGPETTDAPPSASPVGTASPEAATSDPTPTAEPTPIPPLTLDGIFPPRDLSALGLDTGRVRTVIATGDVIPARYVDFTIRNMGDDFLFTVRPTMDIVSDADITLINLEAPLVDYCPVHVDGFTFCGRPGFTEALNAAGVDVVTLENNHIGNYGGTGIDETVAHLEAAGIDWADRYSPSIIDVGGMTFGFIAFNAVGEDIDHEAMVTKIAELDPQVDVLAVSYHWGGEYTSLPIISPGIANDNPIDIAHLAVDAGADLVIGNHPHWVQAVEFYNGKFITYAHGNYIFDQTWSEETRLGVIGKYTFYDDELIGVEYFPTRIEDSMQTMPLEGQLRQDVLDGMARASHDLRADLDAGVYPDVTPGA